MKAVDRPAVHVKGELILGETHPVSGLQIVARAQVGVRGADWVAHFLGHLGTLH